jgi:hypothetical protein
MAALNLKRDGTLCAMVPCLPGPTHQQSQNKRHRQSLSFKAPFSHNPHQ